MADYNNLKVVELKELVKERGIASTGLKLKQHFIDALISNDAESIDDKPDGPVEDVISNEPEATDEAIVESADPNTDQNDGDNNDSEGNANDSESRKRKRRSPTPPPSPNTISKKLKIAQELPDVPGDEPQEATLDVPEEAASGLRDDSAPPQGDEEDREETSVSDTGKTLSQEHPTTMETTEDVGTQPAKHPATRALYIRELVRPLQPSTLHDHLVTIAKGIDDQLPSMVEDFYLDKMRTHAFARFSSIAAASRARNALHDQVWPSESMRKPLWADFVPDDSVQDWINIEKDNPDMTRWEVNYREDSDGAVTASLQKAAPTRPSGDRQQSGLSSNRQPSVSGVGEPSNTPTGPRRSSTQMQSAPSPLEEAEPQNRPFDSLDSRFKFTQTKPKIYYQPLPRERVQQRLGEIDRHTSHDWNASQADPSAYAEGELRRYTFENDAIVDGGPDFGIFGRRTRPGIGTGPSRGGGGGRGRRGGLDYYRGSGRRR